MTTSCRAPWPRGALRALGILAAIAAFTLLLACNAILAGGSSSTDTGDPVSLTGRVTADGGPVAGVVVRLAKTALADTTNSLGVYALHGKLALGKAAIAVADAAPADTLVFARNGIGLARRAVTSWKDSLPDVPVLRLLVSGRLHPAAIPHAARVKAVVTGDGIAPDDSVIVTILPDPLSGNYSAVLYFPVPAEGSFDYVVHVNVYAEAGAIIGRSADVPFSNLPGGSGNIAVPPFEVNLPAVVSGLRDTMVTTGTAVSFSITATDPEGIERYLWDFNGDGVMEDSTLTGTVSHTYPAVSATHEVSVTVRDTRGGLTRATARATVLSAGLEWVKRASPTSEFLFDVIWTGTQFVAVGGNIALALTSPDGINWTSRQVVPGSTSNEGIRRLAFHKGVLYAFAPGQVPNVYKSADGIAWTSHLGNFPFTITKFYSVGDLLVAGGGGGGVGGGTFYRSSDGVLWDIDTVTGFFNGRGVTAFTGHNGLIVGVGDEGNYAVSPDGSDWTFGGPEVALGVFPRGYYLHAVVSTGTNLVAVGDQGVAVVSGNGIDWALTQDKILSPSNGRLSSIVWTGTALVAVGSNVAVSPDRGLTWRQIPLPDSDYRAVAWNGSRLVAVGDSGIVTSP